MKIAAKLNVIYFIAFILAFSCREPFEIESIAFESALVVEGTITNEMRNQEVIISRTFLLNENGPVIENNAQVIVEDSQQNMYVFHQDVTGRYISEAPFQAQENTSYKLFITTNDGKRYESLNVELTPTSEITRLYADFEVEEDNVKVFVDNDNENSEAQFFRYEYEETFKIIVPKFEPTFNIEIINLVEDELLEILLEYDITLVPKTQEQQQAEVCYTTNKSSGINQASTNELNDNVVFRFPVRIIDKGDSVLRERYSILVKQYVQNIESYTFYRIVNELGGINSLLSENQPGFVAGNILALDSEGEKVFGFFESASVSSKRIYFDYRDFNLLKPMYNLDCEYNAETGNENHLRLDYRITGEVPGDFPERLTLFRLLTENNYKYYTNEGEFVYFIVSPGCSDCTSFSSNIIPEFWEE